MRAFMLVPSSLLALTAAAPPPAVGPQTLSCDVSLMMMPQRQLTAPSPVTISFVADSKTVHDIHVVDAGGILYPGGNMKIVQKPDAVAIETVSVPAERPGTWTGAVEKTMYRLTLNVGADPKAAEIGISRTPAKESGRIGLIWNASHRPDGSPQAITGTGVGNCAPGAAKEVQ